MSPIFLERLIRFIYIVMNILLNILFSDCYYLKEQFRPKRFFFFFFACDDDVDGMCFYVPEL